MVRNFLALIIGLVLVSIFLLLCITELIMPVMIGGLALLIAYVAGLAAVESIEYLWQK